MELTYQKIIGGIIVLAIAFGGGTVLLQKTGEYRNCRGLWDFQENGQYQCSKTGEVQWCYEIESRGSGWYRCWLGEPIELPVEEPVVIKKSRGSGSGEVCDSNDCYQN